MASSLRRRIVSTVRSHGVAADATRFLADQASLAAEMGTPVTPIPELGEHAFVTHGSPAAGELTVRFVRDEDWFEVVFQAARWMEKESTLAVFRGLAGAVLAPR